MAELDSSTKEKLLEVGKQEFLEKGFQAASLRNIAKEAGVTTGASYGYFSSKEALFAALVEPCAAAIMGEFMKAQVTFAELPDAEKPDHVGVESGQCVMWMVDYVYQHFDEVKLLVYRSQGTPYETFIHNMVEVEVESTYQYLEVRKRLGLNPPDLPRPLSHIIASGMFNGLFEIVAHDMPYEEAKGYVQKLMEFYQYGWQKMIEG